MGEEFRRGFFLTLDVRKARHDKRSEPENSTDMNLSSSFASSPPALRPPATLGSCLFFFILLSQFLPTSFFFFSQFSRYLTPSVSWLDPHWTRLGTVWELSSYCLDTYYVHGIPVIIAKDFSRQSWRHKDSFSLQEMIDSKNIFELIQNQNL